ncbi:hypothetical protein [Synechococcus sp. MIT S9507]|uniref:hypothetical protein n=1 Tax=Synechococcus sp. MIT S9507 TaxID=3082544 RepID=UPI0039B51BF8
MTRQIEALQEQAAVREEKSHAADVPAWLQARRWMISKGQQKLPTSKAKLIRYLEESAGMRQQLLKELPKVADALGINDDDMQFPEVLLDLLSNAEAEPSVALGRQLLEAGPIDDLVALAPSRATTIRLAVRQWQEDQQRLIEEGIAAKRDANEKERQRIRESIAAHGHPMVRGSAENKELRKREFLRQAGIPVGPRV